MSHIAPTLTAQTVFASRSASGAAARHILEMLASEYADAGQYQSAIAAGALAAAAELESNGVNWLGRGADRS